MANDIFADEKQRVLGGVGTGVGATQENILNAVRGTFSNLSPGQAAFDARKFGSDPQFRQQFQQQQMTNRADVAAQQPQPTTTPAPVQPQPEPFVDFQDQTPAPVQSLPPSPAPVTQEPATQPSVVTPPQPQAPLTGPGLDQFLTGSFQDLANLLGRDVGSIRNELGSLFGHAEQDARRRMFQEFLAGGGVMPEPEPVTEVEPVTNPLEEQLAEAETERVERQNETLRDIQEAVPTPTTNVSELFRNVLQTPVGQPVPITEPIAEQASQGAFQSALEPILQKPAEDVTIQERDIVQSAIDNARQNAIINERLGLDPVTVEDVPEETPAERNARIQREMFAQLLGRDPAGAVARPTAPVQQSQAERLGITAEQETALQAQARADAMEQFGPTFGQAVGEIFANNLGKEFDELNPQDQSIIMSAFESNQSFAQQLAGIEAQNRRDAISRMLAPLRHRQQLLGFARALGRDPRQPGRGPGVNTSTGAGTSSLFDSFFNAVTGI